MMVCNPAHYRCEGGLVEARACERSELECNRKAAQQGQSIYRSTVQISKYSEDTGRSGSPARRHYRHGKVKSERNLA